MFNNDGISQNLINNILNIMENVSNIKTAKIAKTKISNLKNDITHKKIGYLNAKLIFKKLIRNVLQSKYKKIYKFNESKFIDLETKLINA